MIIEQECGRIMVLELIKLKNKLFQSSLGDKKMEVNEIKELKEPCPECGNMKAYLSWYYNRLRCTKCGYGNRNYQGLND